ncbi:DNA-binding transcriptional regulator, LacI/PurR family [Alteromonadaceae bacterium Bs31]|nr:DNA-binding transcriptional regulator, LacI/PurR family [Alteromonadaceae bacterium Bs31]
MFSSSSQPLHLGVITPYLQGDYMGEIINQIRQGCEAKNYRFSAIRTDGFGSYNLAVGVNDLDGVIVIRNAANPKLVERLQNRQIPVVAVAHDYFPLDIPVIASDNAQGAELAFEYLTQKGHQKLLYVGDITQYDLRKRYERFCELQKSHGLPSGSEQLIVAPDTIFSGGLSAGTEFLQRMSKCTGVFCGAGHTAMGFIKKIEEAGVSFPGEIDIVAFDAIRLMKVLTPELSYIDQNLDLLANRCISTLERMIHSKVMPSAAITIAPTLCVQHKAEQNNKKIAEESNAVLSNTDYTSSLLNNSFELTRDIVFSQLDKIMCLAPLFSEFMHFGVLSCVVYDRNRRAHMHTHKIFEHTETTVITGNNPDYVCAPEEFPPKAIRSRSDGEFDTCVHFPIFCKNNLWGILSFFGQRARQHSESSFSSFSSFMDNVTFAYSMLLENADLREELKKSEAEAPHVKHELQHDGTLASFEWDLEKGTVMWSEIALELLGFTTELEKNIYRNMEIFDRVHPDDEHQLRKELTISLSNLSTMTSAIRLKNAEGDYRRYSLQGEILHQEDSRAVHYRCCLSLIN